MPTIKAVVRKGELNSAGMSNIKIRLSHDGKVRYIRTPWFINPKYMGSDGMIKPSCPVQSSMNKAILSQLKEFQDIINDAGVSVNEMSIAGLMARMKGGGSGASFTDYMQKRITSLDNEGRVSLRDLYSVTLNHVKQFNGGESLRFKEITALWLMDFERHLRKGGASVNTVRNYMCNIRAVFNHAINNDLIKQDAYPFRKYRPRQEDKKPRTLKLEELKRLMAYRASAFRSQKKAIDIFFLILFLGGINLKDLIYLKHENNKNGRINYRRLKTGREYSIRVFPETEHILHQYKGRHFLLNIIEKKESITPKNRIESISSDIRSNINARLKKINEVLLLPEKPTTYVARYSFATIAFSLGVERDVIRMILGHGMNNMTDLYIDYKEAESRCDNAIRKVIDAING